MNTKRLYHEDGERRTFDADVISCTQDESSARDSQYAVILDQTAFFPTGGGQPHDTGMLGTARVMDVMDHGSAVIHVVDKPLSVGPITGDVDWDRRLDHRQQHTGQHILSRALEVVADAPTVGFHLGESRCTIDVDHGAIDEAVLDEAEHMSNRVVLEDLPVAVQLHDGPDTIPEGLRSGLPPERPIRLVQIGKFDTNPCCGTHCTRSGQVGPIKILRWENRKGGVRVEFVCGERALRDYAARHRALRESALALTTDEFEVADRIRALQAAGKSDRSKIEKLEEELMGVLVQEWINASSGGVIVGVLPLERESWLAPVCAKLIEAGGRRVLLSVTGGDASKFALALANPKFNTGGLLKDFLPKLEGRGGGSADLARGQLPSKRLKDFEDWVRAL